MMVRRAILRVAFLAEVVLAMFSKFPSAATWSRVACANHAGRRIALATLMLFPGVPENATLGVIGSQGSAQRTSAAGLRPPPLAVL
jgi:hypothetical protein